MKNLNEIFITNADGEDVKLDDYSTSSEDGKTTVLFKNIEKELIKRINSADIIVGCIAWLTSKPILEALSKKKGVSLVVQKEDFLRPDYNNSSNWKNELRNMYNALPNTLSRYDEGWNGTILGGMSTSGDPEIDSVRCVGNYNKDKKPAFPRAHHKFIVFCKKTEISEYSYADLNFEPYEVWTGSFNFTFNAVNSLENVIISKDNKIVDAYLKEAAQIIAISEKLDWETDWVAPEWRLGT